MITNESAITYELLNKNYTRHSRGKEHAKFIIFEDGKKLGYLWMSNSDIKENAKNNPTQKDILYKGLV